MFCSPLYQRIRANWTSAAKQRRQGAINQVIGSKKRFYESPMRCLDGAGQNRFGSRPGDHSAKQPSGMVTTPANYS
ncbi:hypothetical protein RRG08_035240 [Elysia crispata]|uniref:Uncharacterized protein n=1 Tax=Elysia crispata TaxID=231223 RepID=A0AAE1DJL4_9GAST|nr:hypothetical protein RRG08_035240 [Elysia crispata]